MKFPKAIGACADMLYKMRERRLQQQKVVEAMEKDEQALKEHIIKTLPKSEASGVAGKTARVTVVSKEVPQVKDWPKFYAYVKKHDAFELLQRRLSKEAVEERLEEEKTIPGVEMFVTPTVSLNKV